MGHHENYGGEKQSDMQPPFLVGKKVSLRALTLDDATVEYLAWLNDAEVLRYRGPKAFPTTMLGLRSWLESSTNDLRLAITAEGNHVGNIALNTINWLHGHAELSIMVGVSGRGFGTEAIHLLSDHGFRSMRLHRIWAESQNPAFNAIMKKLGWVHEGTKREAFFVDSKHIDIECWGKINR